jgi:DNA-binding NarL/FixJ family response regulator
MASIRILVADDHSVVRRGVRALLDDKPTFIVCGEAASGAETILKAKRLKPDVIVMDISMPEVDGLEATRQLHKELPETAVLVLTMHESEEVVREVMNSGARGYVLKSDLDRNLLMAVEALAEGRPFFSAKVSEIVLNGYLKNSTMWSKTARGGAARPTPRQREVVRLLAEGKTNKEVAAALGISVKTAETHRNQIMRKLELRSFSDLVRYAVREKLVPP